MRRAFGANANLALRLRPQIALTPYLWNEANFLHLPPDALYEQLVRLSERLPVQVSRTGGDVSYDVLAETACEPSPDDEVRAQIAMMRTLPEAFCDPAAWCALLDDRGYLACPASEAAAAFGAGVRDFGEALVRVQDWVEPPGLFAENLADCLSIQLRRCECPGQDTADAACLLRDGLAALERGETARFAANRGWSAERLQAALSCLRRLDPAPGSVRLNAERAVPELEFIREDGAIRCRVMEEHIPRLSLIAGTPQDWDVDRMRQFRGLAARLAERTKTLARIGTSLGMLQRDYLLGQTAYPQVLGLAEIAAETGLHASTVSRVLALHWGFCAELGVFRLSALLMRRMRTRRKERQIDYAYLERAIRSAAEDGLSDAKLAAFLGIPRRTVAYHRVRLGYRRRARK